MDRQQHYSNFARRIAVTRERLIVDTSLVVSELCASESSDPAGHGAAGGVNENWLNGAGGPMPGCGCAYGATLASQAATRSTGASISTHLRRDVSPRTSSMARLGRPSSPASHSISN